MKDKSTNKDETLRLRIETETYKHLGRLAYLRNVSVAALVREFIEQGLQANTQQVFGDSGNLEDG